MEIKTINDKIKWEEFLSQCSEKTFLQSWNWTEFQKTLESKIWRFGVYENGQLLAISLVIKIKAKRGTFLFLPHGPMIKMKNEKGKEKNDNLKSKNLNIFLEELKKIAKQEKCSFIRVAPIWQNNEENKKIFKELGFKQAPIHIHPQLTWQLDIGLAEDQLLANMRKTTRYLIKQGLKNKELVIEKSKNIEDVEIFNKLYQTTVNRNHFNPFSLDYLKNEFSAFLKDGQTLIFLAKHKGECLASAIIIFWQGIGFYHQGASKTSKIPASYLLQWEAIKEAKGRGCKIYNFWGVADARNIKISKYRKHPWAGLTLFKKGFGGYEKEYLKTQDLPLSFKYWLTYIFEKLRKIKRGL